MDIELAQKSKLRHDMKNIIHPSALGLGDETGSKTKNDSSLFDARKKDGPIKEKDKKYPLLPGRRCIGLVLWLPSCGWGNITLVLPGTAFKAMTRAACGLVAAISSFGVTRVNTRLAFVYRRMVET